MAIFRTLNDIVVSFIEYLRLVQSELDTKPGTVARDVFIDAPAIQISDIYNELRNISSLQSLLSSSGSDLTRLGSNFGIQRIRGSNSTGTAVFTTNDLDVDILIPSGTIVTARNGITFRTTTTAIMSSSSSNVHRATATRLKGDLELAGITDPFAIEISCESLSPGAGGNIGRFSLTSQNVAGISSITNLNSFSGGTGIESDSEFRSRILSIFAGSNTGTALGYENAINVDPNVQDVVVVVPGDPLLTRDGTQTITNLSGDLVVSSSGSGGKVDIYVLGANLISAIDSFIYNDQSGTNDPTKGENDVILGQQGEDTTLDSSQRRVNLIEGGALPQQPIRSISSVSGSISGPNFVEKYINSRGEIKGNYELVKDTGSLSGSPFGFDKLRWISNKIEIDNEDITKDIFNGSDSLLFSDVQSIQTISQEVLVTNEDPTKSSSNRGSVYLKHTPVKSVSRVSNITTGERYTVTSQNPDGVIGEPNVTGRITISGGTLPTITDVLQVDYIWYKNFDKFFDFDNLSDRNKFRSVQDSVDWSFGNLVREEPIHTLNDGYSITVVVSDPIFKVVSVNSFSTETSTVSNGGITLSETINNIIDIKRVSDNYEIFNTDLYNGTLSGTTSAIFPSDSLAIDGDSVTVRFNSSDLFSSSLGDGSFLGNTITLPSGTSYDGYVLVTYIANVQNLISPISLESLPIFGSGNNFSISGEISGQQPTSNILENQIKTKNLRRAASNIGVNVSSIVSNGNIVVAGTTFNKIEDALIVITSGDGKSIDFSSAILSDTSRSSIPSSIKVAKIQKIERVNINSSNIVTSIDNTYDIVNYKIRDNSYDLDIAIADSSLNYHTISLPETSENTLATLITGDIIRATFYYVDENDSEKIFFSRSGTQITDKQFSYISKLYISSGFTNAAGSLIGTISLGNFNQPIENTSYLANYSYIAPKENERITVTFSTNDLIRTSTLAVEESRPITSDVLVKEAIAKPADVSARIVILSEFSDSSQTVVQNAIDSVTSFLNANTLGTTVDASDIINNLYTVNGIDRVRILNFSSGTSGNKNSLTANKNEYLSAGIINISAEIR